MLSLSSFSLLDLLPDYIPPWSMVLPISTFPLLLNLSGDIAADTAQRCASLVILNLLKLKVGMKISSDSLEPRKLSQEGQPVFGSSRKG